MTNTSIHRFRVFLQALHSFKYVRDHWCRQGQYIRPHNVVVWTKRRTNHVHIGSAKLSRTNGYRANNNGVLGHIGGSGSGCMGGWEPFIEDVFKIVNNRFGAMVQFNLEQWMNIKHCQDSKDARFDVACIQSPWGIHAVLWEQSSQCILNPMVFQQRISATHTHTIFWLSENEYHIDRHSSMQGHT